MDILPYKVGEGNPWADEGETYYERTYWVHRSIGAEQNSYVCSQKTIGKKCPICEYRAKLVKDNADEDLIKDLAPKERQLFNVIDTHDKDKGIQIWDIAWWLFGKKLDAAIRNEDEDDDYGDFSELEGGSTLKLGVEENRFGGRTFYAIDSIDFKTRKDDYDDDMLNEVHNLDELIKITPYDELKKILLQTEDEDEDDDEKKKARSKKSKSKKKKKQQEEEDEDFDDEEEDENEDEDFDDEEEGKELEKGTEVTFENDKGKTLTGKIVSYDEDDEEYSVKVYRKTYQIAADKLEVVEEDEDEDFDGEEDEDEDDIPFDKDEDEDEEEDEETPQKKSKKKVTKKKSKKK